MPARALLRWLALLTCVLTSAQGCETPLLPETDWTPDPYGDLDGDGTPNYLDCAPWDDTIRGDGDHDGYFDARCYQKSERITPPNDEGPEWWDCDDTDETVHPAGHRPGYEQYEVQPEVARHLNSDAPFCAEDGGAWIVPKWASDGVDNDCDGDTDVKDYDDDGFIDAGWAERYPESVSGPVDCDGCRVTVNPDVDEARLSSADDLEAQQDGASDVVATEGCPVYAYDGIDNDCAGGDLIDLDADGHLGGWHPGSPCGMQINYTQQEVADFQRSDARVRNAELIEAASWADQALDCDDIVEPIHPGAAEHCDDIDWNCSFPKSEPWEEHDDQRYTVDGFSRSTDGRPGYQIYVDPSASNPGGGASPDEALPGLEAVVDALALCPVVNLAEGEYDFSMVLPPEEEAEEEPTGGHSPAGSWMDTLPWPRHIVFQGAAEDPEGVVWRGVGGPALWVEQLPDALLELEHLSFKGDGDGEGGVVVRGGALGLREVRFSDVRAGSAAVLSHLGVEAELQDVQFEGRSDGVFGCASLIGSRATLRSVSFEGCHASSAAGGALSAALAARDQDSSQDNGLLSVYDLTITDSSSGLAGGGAALSAPRVSLSEVTVSDTSAAEDGGGLQIRGEQVTLSGVTVTDAAAGEEGGGLKITGEQVTLRDLTLRGNHSGEGGGGLSAVTTSERSAASLTASDLLLEGNTAGDNGGGALLSSAGSLTLTDTTVLPSSTGQPSDAGRDGGGVWLNAVGTLRVDGFEGSGGTAGRYGGSLAVNSGGAATLSGVDVDCGGSAGHEATRGGGAYVVANDTLALEGLRVQGCSASRSGGGLEIWANGAVTLGGGLELSDNHSDGDGGGLSLWADAVTHSEGALLLQRNTANQHGGGAWIWAISVELSEGLELWDNGAGLGDHGNGGGLWLDLARLRITDVSASGNEANGQGGAIWVSILEDQDGEADGTIEDLAGAAYGFYLGDGHFTGNEAVGDGGALYLTGGGDVHVADGELDSNHSVQGSGGGIYANTLDSLFLEGLYVFDTPGQTSAGRAGGGVAVEVVDMVHLLDSHFEDLAAGDQGGAISMETVRELRMGDASPTEGHSYSDHSRNEPEVSITGCVAGSVGGGLALRSIGDAEVDALRLDGNDADSRGVQLHLNGVEGWFNHLNVLNGGAGSHASICGGDCVGEHAFYQTQGDVDLTNSKVEDNSMEGWAIVLSQAARLNARNVLVAGNVTRTSSGGGDEKGAIWAKNSATLFTQSVTIKGNNGMAIRGGAHATLTLGCTALSNNYKGIKQDFQYGHEPQMFCVATTDNTGNQQGAQHNLQVGGNSNWSSPASSVDHVCVVGGRVGYTDRTSTWANTSRWPDVTSVSAPYCLSCETTLACKTGMHVQETQTTEDGAEVRGSLTVTCGASSIFPFGYDESEELGRWYEAGC